MDFIKVGAASPKLKITLTEKNIIYSTRDIPYGIADYNRGFSIIFSI
ncbi:hypothetical protein [Clostridium perfringens]